jgi:ParB family chromosome partitioning protein
MTKKRRMFDIDLPEGPVPETFPAGKVDDPPRRGPMAAAIAETADASRERQQIETQIRAENDALAHEHVRLRRLGLVVDLVPLDRIAMAKLVRDRKKGPDAEMAELKASIRDLGLSNPIRLEARADGRFELIQGYRRLTAYRELLEETGDADRYGAIPAAVSQPGEDLDALYRKMVDENLVRKDISFAEMAALAIDFAADPGTTIHDPDKAVVALFRSAGYQKRSYIRTFVTVVQRLGGDLMYPQEIPRALGLALARRLEEVEGLVPLIRAELADWDTPLGQRRTGRAAPLCRRDRRQPAGACAARGAARTAGPGQDQLSVRPQGRAGQMRGRRGQAGDPAGPRLHHHRPPPAGTGRAPDAGPAGRIGQGPSPRGRFGGEGSVRAGAYSPAALVRFTRNLSRRRW